MRQRLSRLNWPRDLRPCCLPRQSAYSTLQGRRCSANWAIAKVGDKEYRVNGQHSAGVLAELNGQFPQGLIVHLDTYEVDSLDGLALLFRQFDSRKSGRTPTDVSGAYQGLYPELRDVPRNAAKLAVEGAAWYEKKVEHLPAPSGDERYSCLARNRCTPS